MGLRRGIDLPSIAVARIMPLTHPAFNYDLNPLLGKLPGKQMGNVRLKAPLRVEETAGGAHIGLYVCAARVAGIDSDVGATRDRCCFSLCVA